MTTKIKPARIDSTQDFTFANVAAVAITANTIVANGSVGANGNVLASNGSSIYWSNTSPGVSGVNISSIALPGSHTAVDVAGGETVVVTGIGFKSGITAYLDTTNCNTTFTNSTSASFITPALSSNVYSLVMYNTDGSSGIMPSGVRYYPAPVWVTSAGALPDGPVGVAYSTSVSATGASITYSVTSGSLPANTSLDSSTGAITGTPTTATTYNFTITATDTYGQTTSRAFSIVVNNTFTANTLVIAGGGSGGTGYYGGGGGAGGLLESNSTSLVKGVTYTITVGAGGVGTTVQTNRGGNGVNSAISGTGFTTITAVGGGGGGSRNNDVDGAGAQGANGGSGGGASYIQNAGGKGVYPGSTYLSQPRQGYDGGSSLNDAAYSLGGGGAGGPGQTTAGAQPRSGGLGLASTITGTSTYYASGGGNAYGTSYVQPGGGGAQNTNGSPNTGGGGGGASGNNSQGGSGGSGVVIIKYPDSHAAATVTGSPTITSIAGYRVYTFTGSGTFRVD